MVLPAGTRLGPFEVHELLGTGGMGEVYHARDTRLERSVAIKVLPAALSKDPERRQRFEREARAIAALTHPHICTLYDVGHDQGNEYLVMELVEGETLAARLARGPLPLAEAVERLIEIAAALDAAHRLGIVHRDLKPGNVMLTRSGAKLLDFGLARLREETVARIEGLTETAPLTGKGQILGTLHYMAPEQLEGERVDERADLFAFGAIAHEMISGNRAFSASSAASLIAAVMHSDPPPLSQLDARVPVAVERVIAICLAKRPDDRWSSAHDVFLQLRAIAGEPVFEAHADEAQPQRSGRLGWALAILTSALAVALAGALLVGGRPQPSTAVAGARVLSVMPPPEAALVPGEAPQISPDGRQIAFVASDRSGRTQLYLRSLDSLAARSLPGTDGASLPFWAPDSRRLGFFAQGQLKTISVEGGSATSLAAAPVPRGGAWGPDDTILFIVVPSQPLYRVAASGGEVIPVPTREGSLGGRSFPSFLPDGRHYLYLGIFARSEESAPNAVFVGSLDSSETKELFASRWSAVYVDPGYVLFRRGKDLMVQPFDPRTLELSGTPVQVAEDVGFNAITYQALLSASAPGTLTYLAESAWSELEWFDRRGTRLGQEAPAAQYTSLCLTADDKKVVYDVADPISGSVDVWTQTSGENNSVRLTFDPAVDFFVVCSRTRQEVIFASLREGPPNLFRMPIATPGSEQAILRSPAPKVPTDWSTDGQLVVYSVLVPESSMDIEILDLGDGSIHPFVATRANERSARLSPDQRWIAYVSNETDRDEVYVQPYPPTGAKWQISQAGGTQPQWRADGSELFYLAPDSRLMAVGITVAGSDLVPAEARALAETRATGSEPNGQGSLYAVAAGGERFLVSSARDDVLPITVIENWQARLEVGRELSRPAG